VPDPGDDDSGDEVDDQNDTSAGDGPSGGQGGGGCGCGCP
jgi:hypothetical protein